MSAAMSAAVAVTPAAVVGIGECRRADSRRQEDEKGCQNAHKTDFRCGPPRLSPDRGSLSRRRPQSEAAPSASRQAASSDQLASARHTCVCWSATARAADFEIRRTDAVAHLLGEAARGGRQRREAEAAGGTGDVLGDSAASSQPSCSLASVRFLQRVSAVSI